MIIDRGTQKQKEHGTEKPRPASAEWPARTVGLSVHVYGRKGRAFGNYVTRTQRNLLLQVSVSRSGLGWLENVRNVKTCISDYLGGSPRQPHKDKYRTSEAFDRSLERGNENGRW